MSLDILLLIALIAIALILWRTAVAASTPPKGGRRRSPPEPPADESITVAQLTTEWADPVQAWAALDVENALLTARMSGRIGTAEYRAAVADLAQRCDPAPGTNCPPAESGSGAGDADAT